MPSLWKAIKTRFRAWKDEAAEAASDKVIEGKYAIEDSQQAIDNFRRQISQLVASNKVMIHDRDQALSAAKKYQKTAEAAANAGNREDAKKALEERNNNQAKADGFSLQIEQNEKVVAALRKQIDAAESKVAKAKSNHAQLAARKKGAEIRKALAESSNRFGNSGSPLAALDDLDRVVVEEEAQAEALEEMACCGAEDLVEKYESASADVDSELDDLMKSRIAQ